MKQRKLKLLHVQSHRLGLLDASQTKLTRAIAARLAHFEAEVARGERDARSLVAIPPALGRSARVTFPDKSFGEPLDWLGDDEALLRKARDRLATKDAAVDVDVDDL